MSARDLLTEFEINSLLVREQYYVDTCQWDKLRSLYHQDPSKTNLKISWFHGDIDGFVEGSKVMATKGANALHTIQPVEIHVVENKAMSESVGTIQLRIPYEGSEHECCSYIRYLSRLEKVENEWKLLSLRVIYVRDFIVPVSPSARPVAIDVDSAGGRQSYKCVTWLLAQRGGKFAQDLPGTDDPSSVEALIAEHREWLRH